MIEQYETFTEFIENNKGFVFRSGKNAHKADELCALSYDLLCRIIDLYENKSHKSPMDKVNLAHATIVHNDLKKLFGFDCNHNTSEAYEKVLHGKIIVEDKQLASDIFNKDVSELFNILSPDGYSFGIPENGTFLGWFKNVEC